MLLHRLIGFKLNLNSVKKSLKAYRVLFHVSPIKSVELAATLSLDELFLFLPLFVID